MTVDPKYHPKIIGRKGAKITNIRTEHDVNIQLPEKNDESQVRRFTPPNVLNVHRRWLIYSFVGKYLGGGVGFHVEFAIIS